MNAPSVLRMEKPKRSLNAYNYFFMKERGKSDHLPFCMSSCSALQISVAETFFLYLVVQRDFCLFFPRIQMASQSKSESCDISLVLSKMIWPASYMAFCISLVCTEIVTGRSVSRNWPAKSRPIGKWPRRNTRITATCSPGKTGFVSKQKWPSTRRRESIFARRVALTMPCIRFWHH